MTPRISEPQINIRYWAAQYEATADDDEIYHDAVKSHTTAIERARALWDWKDLSRGVPFEQVEPVLSTLEFGEYLELPPSDAVASLSSTLVEKGALKTETVVAPAFILHLADSGPDEYSSRFPIFDARCWKAFVFLTKRRGEEEKLPVGATTSSSRYGEFSQYFSRTLPERISGRQYEKALFKFGGYIGRLPVETIGEISEYLTAIERNIHDQIDTAGFALTDPP
jgi:hypothetical protein